MSNVTELKTSKVVVDESVVKVLEEALKMAREGQLVGVNVAGVQPSGACWTYSSACHQFTSMVGSLEIAKQRLIVSHDTRVEDLAKY